jgi:hypothetical protein
MTFISLRRSWQLAGSLLASGALAFSFAATLMGQQVSSAGPSVALVGPANNIPTSTKPQDPQTQASQEAAIMAFFRRTEVSGFVDMYYSYNFNKPSTRVAQLRNFDVQHNSISLNLAEFSLNKVPTADSRGGFRLDLDYGPTQATIHAAEPGGANVFQNIGQAYLSYLAPAGRGLQFDVGKFVTPLGYEVIKTRDNWNYSRSLLFTLAIPYYHVGARATYSFTDNFSLAGYVLNGWNNAVDNNTGKTVAVQGTIKPASSLTIVQNYIGGPEQANNNSDWRHVSDTILSYAVTSKVSLAANYDYGQDRIAGSTVRWTGVAGYIRVQPNSWFAFSPRAEYYNDRDGFTTGAVQKVKEVTLTAELKHKDGVQMRLEYRRDFSSVPFFLKKGTETIKNQDTVTVGVLYTFSFKAQ